MKLPILLTLLVLAVVMAACVLQPTAQPDAAPTETPSPNATAAAPVSTPRTTTATTGATTATAATPRPTTPNSATGIRGVRKQYSGPPPVTIDTSAEYIASFRTNQGNFRVQLLPVQAPVTVNNFVFLAKEGFYDGLTFHRVIQDFMIQGGDPTGNGAGGPGYRFQDEISPALIFDSPGKLAMANSGAGTSTNGSQFFITTVPTPHLNGSHTIFGEIIDGQNVVDQISRVSTDLRDRPLQRVVIERIEVAITTRAQ